MELELGVKLTRAADDFVSEFQIAKDRAGPVFLSRETDTFFILTAHLKGYKRANIKIDINEDGTLIAISGEKRVQETVMVGWKMYKKDTEVKGFKKVFRIPDGVILDKINAIFSEDESTLTISMPKKVRGIRGMTIEEAEEKEQLKEASGNFQIADEKTILKTETLGQEKDERPEPNPETHVSAEDTERVHHSEAGTELIGDRDKEKGPNGKEMFEETKSFGEENSSLIHAEVQGTEIPKEETKDEKVMECIQERTQPRQDQELQDPVESNDDQHECRDQVPEKVDEILEEEKKEDETEAVSTRKLNRETCENGPETICQESKPPEKRCKLMCTPIIASSALLLSLVVFVIQIIRNKNQASKKRD